MVHGTWCTPDPVCACLLLFSSFLLFFLPPPACHQRQPLFKSIFSAGSDKIEALNIKNKFSLEVRFASDERANFYSVSISVGRVMHEMCTNKVNRVACCCSLTDAHTFPYAAHLLASEQNSFTSNTRILINCQRVSVSCSRVMGQHER